MKVIMVIGVYNEAESTPKLIDELAKVVPQIKNHQLEFLFVDGNSPDGTATIIRKYQQKYPWIHLLVEKEKNGLGAAYAIGMTYAMKELKADFVGEMDGDLQHPPMVLKKLIDEIDNGYEFVIASRYIQGGEIPKDWGFSRKFLSVVGNLVARVLLVLPRVHDVTGGYKISKVKGFMDEFDFKKLLSKRFAYKVHLLFYMIQKGAKVKEVPFSFAPRLADESKIGKNDLQETLRVIFWLQFYNPKLRRFLKFGIVGGTGLAIQTTFFEVLSVFTQTLTPAIATVIGGEVAILSNFILNNFWTFNQFKVTGIKMISKFVQFNTTSLIALTIQFAILKIGEHVAAGNKVVIQGFYFGAIILVLITNYYIYNKFIWKTAKKE